MNLEDEMNEAIKRVQSRIYEWSEARAERFIEMLIKSGDVFMVSGPTRIVTEDTVDATKTINLQAQNLFCYEPFHMVDTLNRRIEELKAALQVASGHSNCYCKECIAISKKHWLPSKALSKGIE